MMNNKEFAELATNGDQLRFIHMDASVRPTHVGVITYRPDKSKKTILDVLSDVAKNGFTSLMNNVSSEQTIDGIQAADYLKNLQEEANKLPKGMLNRRFNVSTVLINKQTHKTQLLICSIFV